MNRTVLPLFVVLAASLASSASAAIKGLYMETRTCQVYTGPCFANAETQLTGKDAILAWSIQDGDHNNVSLSGLNVVVVVNASDTLGSGGISDAREIKSVIYVDDRADASQSQALVDFAKSKTGKAGSAVVRIQAAPIRMDLNTSELKGQLLAGKDVTLKTRPARKGDCICTNEIAYYPPLAQVENFAVGVAIEGEFKGRGLGTQWSTPENRSVYMGTFAY